MVRALLSGQLSGLSVNCEIQVSNKATKAFRVNLLKAWVSEDEHLTAYGKEWNWPEEKLEGEGSE